MVFSFLKAWAVFWRLRWDLQHKQWPGWNNINRYVHIISLGSLWLSYLCWHDHHDHSHDLDDNHHDCRQSSCLAATATNLHRALLSPRVAPWFIVIMIIMSLILISHDIDEPDYKQDVQGLQLFLHTNEKDVYSGFKGKWESFFISIIIFIFINVIIMMWPRYMFMPAKSPFGDCGGNITDSENGFIKSPNYPEKYTTNDQSESSNIDHWCSNVWVKPSSANVGLFPQGRKVKWGHGPVL